MSAERCGATTPFIPRMGLTYVCVLSAGHSGEHSAGMVRWPQAPHAAAAPSIGHNAMTIEPVRAMPEPKLAAEVEAAIDAHADAVDNVWRLGSRHEVEAGRDVAAARAALVSAIEKYVEQRIEEATEHWV